MPKILLHSGLSLSLDRTDCIRVVHHTSTIIIIILRALLCDAVHDEIGPMLQRRLKVGRTKGIVDRQQATVLFRSRRHGANVCNFQRGIGGRFEPNQFRCAVAVILIVVVKQLEGLGMRHVDKIDRNAHGRTDNAPKVALGATVDIIDAQDAVALFEQMHDGRRGRTAGTKGDAIGRPALGGGHGAFKGAPRGIARARVLVPEAKAVGVTGVDRLPRHGLLERGGQTDGGHHGARRISGTVVVRQVTVQVGCALAPVRVCAKRKDYINEKRKEAR